MWLRRCEDWLECSTRPVGYVPALGAAVVVTPYVVPLPSGDPRQCPNPLCRSIGTKVLADLGDGRTARKCRRCNTRWTAAEHE